MVNLCLCDNEKNLLKRLLGEKLLKIRHDPLDKFGYERVYGRVELFFKNQIISLDYDYAPYPIFGGDNDRPRFLVKQITENEAVSMLENTAQIDVLIGKRITGITLIEDYVEAEWLDKNDTARIMVAIAFRFGEDELVVQGDYMMPILKLIKGKGAIKKLTEPGFEFADDPDTKYKAERFYVDI